MQPEPGVAEAADEHEQVHRAGGERARERLGDGEAHVACVSTAAAGSSTKISPDRV